MKAGTAGGIEAIVKVIKAHINKVNVCFYGCGALRNIADNGKITFKRLYTL